MIQGKYQHKPPLPFSPGGEAAGDVAAVGPGVTPWKEGDAVCFGSSAGGFAEAVNVPAAALKPIPGKMNYEKAASYGTAYMTAYVALKVRGELKAGEWLLVHGATGGVGMAAVDLGKHFGAHVIGTGGRDDKLAVVKSRGADAVINYTLPDGSLGGFRDKVKQITGGGGADVIYDPVGGDVFDESMRCVNWRGRILTIGFTSGRWPQAPVNLILIKSISVIGVRAGEIGRRDPELGRKEPGRALGTGAEWRDRSLRLRGLPAGTGRGRDADAREPRRGGEVRRHDERLRGRRQRRERRVEQRLALPYFAAVAC